MATLSLLPCAFVASARAPQACAGPRASCATRRAAAPRAGRLSSREAAASAPLRLDSRVASRAAPRARIAAPVRALTITQTVVDLDTPSGKMRTYLLKPAAPGKYPGIVFYSEIFQARSRNRHARRVGNRRCKPLAPRPRNRFLGASRMLRIAARFPPVLCLPVAGRSGHVSRQLSRAAVDALFLDTAQVTGPVRRSAQIMASHGFIVSLPEIYHEYEAPGVAFSYEGSAGVERGNELKITKSIAAYDADSAVSVKHLASHPDCTGAVGVMGF